MEVHPMNVVNFGSLNIDHVYACLLYTSDAADE